MEDSEVEVLRACVVGGGAFGTALGMVLASKKVKVSVWVRCQEQASEVNSTRENKKYLPGVKLPDNMEWSSDISKAVEGAELVLLAIPTQFLRNFLEKNRSTLPVGVPIVLCAKGIEIGSLQTPFEITRDELPGKYSKFMCVIAGPSFAKEIAEFQPTMVTCAAEDPHLSNLVQRQLSSKKASFRVYTSSDIIGCEIAGAVKNVLAIASGASAGCGFGNNTRAGLICRGLTELTRLAHKLGATGDSLPGLAGVGDLLLTCTSPLSRNYTVGYRIAANGETWAEIKVPEFATNDSCRQVEVTMWGRRRQAALRRVLTQLVLSTSCHSNFRYNSLKQSLSKVIKNVGQVDMPICQQVYAVLYENKAFAQALHDLQDRPLTNEFGVRGAVSDAPSPPY